MIKITCVIVAAHFSLTGCSQQKELLNENNGTYTVTPASRRVKDPTRIGFVIEAFELDGTRCKQLVGDIEINDKRFNFNIQEDKKSYLYVDSLTPGKYKIKAIIHNYYPVITSEIDYPGSAYYTVRFYLIRKGNKD